MTPASVTAFCPGHISGYFRRVDGHDPATTGSIGAGIVINEGVTATVRLSPHSSVVVRVRSPEGTAREISRTSPPLSFALDRLGVTVAVETVCPAPYRRRFRPLCRGAPRHAFGHQQASGPRSWCRCDRRTCPRDRGNLPYRPWGCCCMPGRRARRADRPRHPRHDPPQFRS